MSTAYLLENPFKDPRIFEEWAFQHDNDHREILEAVQTDLKVPLIQYTLYPFSKKDLQFWLIRHQSMHNAFNGILGFDSTDLNRVDFNDPSQQENWISQNFTEHFSARAALGI